MAIINVPSRKIGEETIKEFLRIANQKCISLWAVVQKIVRGDLALQKKVSKPAEQGLGKLVNMILDAKKSMITMIPDDAPKKLLDALIVKLSYKDYLESKHPDDHENRWANVEELLTQAGDLAEQKNLSQDTNFDEELPEIEGVKQQQLEGSEEVLARFLASISLSADLRSSDDDLEKQCITISTIHAAKGLEWPVVFIPAVYEGSIPHSRAEDIDEERRLLYVAMTRAQTLLYLSIPWTQSTDNTKTTLSQFLPDTLGRRFSEVGPNFNEKVVADIAGILHRPEPSQKQLVDSWQSMSAADRANDDLWPADGSKRPKDKWDNDAAKPDRSDSTYHTFSSSRNGFTGQREDEGRCLLPPTSFGFTTAGEHFKSVGVPSKYATDLCSYDGQARPQKVVGQKDKKNRGGSIQPSLSTFFARGSSGAGGTRDFAVLEEEEAILYEGIMEAVLPPILKTNSIPEELLSHKICSTSRPLKRPRGVLEETTTPNKNRYSQFSSSPTHGTQATRTQVEDEQAQVKDDSHNRSISCFTGGVATQSTSTVSSQGHGGGIFRPAATMHTTSMAILQQSTAGRKTYGARRGLTSGWDARKHK